jgi:protein gp37
MARQSVSKGISWCEETWNWFHGCSRIRRGCDHCWAVGQANRNKARTWTIQKTEHGINWSGKIKVFSQHLKDPLRWKEPRRIAVGLMGDIFHQAMPIASVDQAMTTMVEAGWHRFLLLTKRGPEARHYLTNHLKGRIEYLMKNEPLQDWPPRNIWIGASMEDQEAADTMLPAMATLAEMGWPVFVSYEPALGAIDWRPWKFIRWLIAGGEKGPRPAHPDWIRMALNFCLGEQIPFHFKQWGKYYPDCQGDCGHPSSDGLEGYAPSPSDQERVWRCCLCGRLHGAQRMGSIPNSQVGFYLQPGRKRSIAYRFEAAAFDYSRTPPKKVLDELGLSPRRLDGQEWLQFPEDLTFLQEL